MKWQWSLASLVFLASSALAQDVIQGEPVQGGTLPSTCPCFGTAPVVETPPEDNCQGGFLTGERSFPNFIGYLSNPELAVDPRSLTQMTPIFASTWISGRARLPGGDIQVYGAALDVALSERLSFGLNRGGYAVAHFDKTRDGWLNLGGFVQYEVIRDVPDQFLVTAGLGVETPSGQSSVFQGSGPAYLAPYITVAKEFGNYHVLVTTGYQFPAGSGTATTNTFYGSVHFDRRMWGWLYPVLEFNWAAHTTTVNDQDLRDILAHFNFEPTIDGNLVTVAPGVNMVLVPNRLEAGVVYQTPIASEHNFRFNEVLLKIVLRY